ncbi:uncharacterized protein QC761_111910 [Podospora bellae-mahoneyi]|uniref:Uncharacterized protein n=1 Tax=Podospora bellae-mahoneyi TaxID=2093777 RepID=A0ABR0FXE0_9PEZI|nr:hypothetical protein QC761_111910 [Podospora bellae-mahoneyi]
MAAFERDEAKCLYYAAFASHLHRQAFDFIYWFLFILVVSMLFLSSWKYSGDMEKVSDLEPGCPEYKKKMKRCFYVCALYSSISVVAVVMEVYALLALQFCDGEDLMSLYWSTWTMLQVGSLIAIFGILLAVYNSVRARKNPPWALALGTPVLVVAGIGHALHSSVRRRAERMRSRSRSRARHRAVSNCSSSRMELNGVPISREQTLFGEESEKEDGEIPGKLVGYTPDGSPIIRFTEDPGRIGADRGEVICRGEGGHVIVAFRKGMTTIINGAISSPPPAALLPVPMTSPGPSYSSAGLTVQPRSPVVKIELPTTGRTTPTPEPRATPPTVLPRDSPV